MAPGGNSYLDVSENRGIQSDYEMKSGNMEVSSSAFRKSASMGRRLGMVSDNAVHDLLECPVCMNSMYPPIHQIDKLRSNYRQWEQSPPHSVENSSLTKELFTSCESIQWQVQLQQKIKQEVEQFRQWKASRDLFIFVGRKTV